MSRQTGLPRFTSQQQVGGQPVADTSGAAQSLTQLGQRLQQFGSQQLVRTQTQRAVQQGEVAGLNPNFRPSGVGGVATQAFNQAALQANKGMMTTDAVLGTAKNKLEAEQSSPDAAIQAQNFQKLQSQASSQLINQAPDANKAVVQNVLAHQSGVAMLDFQKNIFKQQSIKTDAQSIQTDNTMRAASLDQVNRIHWDAKDKELPKQELAAAGQFLQQRNNAVQLRELGGHLKPKEARRLMQHNKDEFNEQILMSQFQTKLHQGNQQANDFVKFVSDAKSNLKGFSNTNSALKNYSDDQRLILASKMKKMKQDQSNTSTVNSAYLTTQLADEKRAILNGAQPNEHLRSIVETNAPKRLPEFDRMTGDAQIVHAAVSHITRAPLALQDSLLAEMKPRNTKDPDFGRKLGIWQTVNNMVGSTRAAIKTDQAKYFLNSPQMSHPVNTQQDRNQVGVDFSKMPSNGWSPLPANVARNLVISQVHYGIPEENASVLTNDMAKGIVQQFNSIPNADQRIALINQWAQQTGELFPNFARDLINKGGLSSDAQFLIGIRPDNPNIGVYNLLTGLSKDELRKDVSPDDKKDIDKGDFDQHDFGKYIDSIAEFHNANTEKHIEQIKGFLRDYAYASLKTSGKFNKDATAVTGDTALKKAQQDFGQRFNYVDLHGKTLRVPPKYDEQVIRGGLVRISKNMKSFNIKPANIFVQQGLSLKQAQKETRDQMLPGGGFVTNSDNSSAIFVNKNGKAIVDNDTGLPLTVKFDDIVRNHQLKLDELVREKAALGPITRGLLDLNNFLNPLNLTKKQRDLLEIN